VTAKAGHCRAEIRIDPEVLFLKLCELILLPVGPKACSGIAVIDGISRGVVPTAELGGKREVSFQRRADGDAINGYERSLVQKSVDADPGYAASKGLNIDVVYPRVVELIENHDLQEHVSGFGVVGELGSELPQRLLDQFVLQVKRITFCLYKFDSDGGQHQGSIHRTYG